MSNDNVKTESIPNISCGIFSCEEVYRSEQSFMKLQLDDLTEVCLIVAGSGVHLVLNQETPCRAGDLFITPPNTPHGYFLVDKAETLTVRRLRFSIEDWFDGEIAAHGNPRYCYGIFNDDTSTAYAMLNAEMQERITAIYNGIEEELAERNTEWHDAIRGYLAQLLIHVGRYINCSIKTVSSVYAKESNMVLATIRAAKEKFCDPDFTLNAIAESFCVSKSHLSKVFKNLTGELFSDYLRNVRMERACLLLRDSAMTVPDVMKACGLRDLPSFYKSFNNYRHMTPQEYRQSVTQPAQKAENNHQESERRKIMSILNDISENLQRGKAKIVKELVQQALDEGADPEQILNEGLLSGMSVIGEKFKNNEVFVPEVLVAARAMNMGAQILKPALAASGVVAKGKVCIGTVQGDLHDIGKNLVKMMMEGKGLEVVDLGTDVPAATFVQTAIEQNCQVICCSALLTTTMEVMAEVVREAEKAGIRDKVKIMIGGAPINQEFCDLIHADCYTPDAASAADAAVLFCNR